MSDSSDTSTAESEGEFFERTGPMPVIDENDRVYPRYYFRSCAEVMIYPLDESQPVPPPCFVLTRDLSRDRVSLIHHEQLAPGQRLDVVLNGEAATAGRGRDVRAVDRRSLRRRLPVSARRKLRCSAG